MRYTVLVFFFLISAILVAGESLKLVNDPWPPYTSDDLPQKGIATQIVKLVLKRAGYNSEVGVFQESCRLTCKFMPPYYP